MSDSETTKDENLVETLIGAVPSSAGCPSASTAAPSPLSSQTTPNPGSDEAVSRGCTCPILDNSHGKGYMGSGEFWISDGCQLHAPKSCGLVIDNTGECESCQ